MKYFCKCKAATSKTNYFYIILLFLGFSFFSCETNSRSNSSKNDEVKMQEVIIADNYSMNLPSSVTLHSKNRWKIGSSSNFLGTIILSETIKGSSITRCMNDLYNKNKSKKNNIYLLSEKELEIPNFKVFIKSYSGKAGSSYLASSIYYTGMILDEIDGNRRFTIEFNSITLNHSFMTDSIVSSFKRIM